MKATSILDAKRATGRTTRMLAEAVRLRDEGHAVYVIAANYSHVKMLRQHLGDSARGIEVTAVNDTFDWTTMRVRGSHPNIVTLVDHYAIECRIGPLLEMWTRFDQETPQ